MMTLLVLSPNPEFVATVRAALAEAAFRVVHRSTLEEAEPLLVHGLAQACLLDLDLRDVKGTWQLERLRQRAPRCPLIVCGESHSNAEEQAYLLGASKFIGKPVPARALAMILDKVLDPRAPLPPATVAPKLAEHQPVPDQLSATQQSTMTALTVLRDFSGIFKHSLDSGELLRQFLQLLRQIVGVNRAAVFLRPPASIFCAASEGKSRELRAAASIGLTPGITEHLQLSLDRGLGAQMERLGRILRANSDEARADLEAVKEFELLGARVAVPISGREGLIGVAVLDGRVTGESLSNPELELIFHLLEHVGLAIHNIWLHEQQAANHQLLTNVLRELSSACLVVDRELRILHANKTARKYFGQGARGSGELDFVDLPRELGEKLYQVLQTGAALAPFRYAPEKPPGTVYSITIVPFQREKSGQPGSVLLTAEDLSQSEQLRRLELEANDLRMVKNMAHRLVAETGNAIVPLNTFVQIPPDSIDKKLVLSMLPALKDSDKRIERRVKQFRYLAEDAIEMTDRTTVGAALDKAYSIAQHYLPTKNVQLIDESGLADAALRCNLERLTHALGELLMNAIQASTERPVVTLRRTHISSSDEAGLFGFDIHDNGTGFSKEAFEKVGRHFFTTRIPGLGLGLAVARKIIESHGGRLEIAPPTQTDHGVIRVLLPVAVSTTLKG